MPGNSYEFESAWRGALSDGGFFREIPGHSIGSAKTALITVSSSTTPVYTDGDPPILTWLADAATTVLAQWNFSFPDDYAETKNAPANVSTSTDEIRILLEILGNGTAGTSSANGPEMTPTISYRRAATAAASAVALTGYRTGLTLDALWARTNNFTAGTTFKVLRNSTNPSFVELQFRGKGFKAFDAAKLVIAPTASTTIDRVDLYGISIRPRRFAAPVWEQSRI